MKCIYIEKLKHALSSLYIWKRLVAVLFSEQPLVAVSNLRTGCLAHPPSFNAVADLKEAGLRQISVTLSGTGNVYLNIIFD